MFGVLDCFKGRKEKQQKNDIIETMEEKSGMPRFYEFILNVTFCWLFPAGSLKALTDEALLYLVSVMASGPLLGDHWLNVSRSWVMMCF